MSLAEYIPGTIEYQDRKADKLIQSRVEPDVSKLIDVNQITIDEVEEWSKKDYPQFLEGILQFAEKYPSKIDIVPIKDVITGKDYTESIAGRQEKLYTFEIGNPNADNRMVVECVKHGGERIHRVTGYMFLKSLVENQNETIDEVLDKVRISVLPLVDPMGAHKGTRGYVDMQGDETNNPVIVSIRHMRNLYGWADANAAEGRNLPEAKGRRIRSIQNHNLNVFGPINSYASLHETVMYPNLAFKNEGVMILLHHYFTGGELNKLSHLKRALTNVDKMKRKMNIFKKKTKFIEDELENHPNLEKTKSIRERIRMLGLRVYGDKLEKALRKLGQGHGGDISLDESLLTLGPFYKKAGIILAPDFYVNNGVTNAMTIETFSKPEVDRVKEGLGFLEAKLQVEILGKRYDTTRLKK